MSVKGLQRKKKATFDVEINLPVFLRISQYSLQTKIVNIPDKGLLKQNWKIYVKDLTRGQTCREDRQSNDSKARQNDI